MKKYIFLLFFFFIFNFIYSREISVKVIDNDLDIPLEGVKIQVKSNPVFFTTDKNGTVKLSVDDKEKNFIITALLVGYNNKKYYIKENENNIILKMSIQGVIEGNELVIEKDKVGKNDEELGVSTVIDESQLNSTAKMGMIEDVMSTIKTLPGVSYGGAFNAQLSVRGGHPDELTCLFDGFLIRYPYHWGGAYSVFNPNMVKSVKFSTGIFNVKNGNAMSGLIEVDSVYPNEGFKFDTKLATNTYDLLIQAPIGKTSGIFVGTRLIFTNLAMMLSDAIKKSNPSLQDGFSSPTAPYIYDAYLKWYWKPNDRFEWFVDGFFDSDGINIHIDENKNPNVKSGIKSIFDFFYYNYDAVGFTGFKILPTDKIFISFLGGYEYLANGLNSYTIESGEKRYSNDFVDEYNALYHPNPADPERLNHGDTFTIDDLKSNHAFETATHSIQSRLDFDFTLTEKIILSTGIGLTYDMTNNWSDGKFYTVDWSTGVPVYKKIKYSTNAEKNQALKSYLYLNFIFDILPDTLKIELGCRLDHVVYYILDNGETLNNDTYHFTTYPVPGPRLNITYSPVKNLNWLEKFSISAGVGLFTKQPADTGLKKEMGLKDFQIYMPKALSTVLGTEFQFPLGFKFKIEGYYKYYYDNYYINAETSATGTKYIAHTDGIGHAAGFDLILERKISRYIDGWISYSFIFARYLNPKDDGNNTDVSNPRGQWYYPSYQRFHTLSIVLNIRPTPWFTITTSFTFASGTPLVKYKKSISFPAYLDDGTLIQMYARQTVYSDVLRSDVSFPLDIKFTFNTYLGKSKVKFEAYIAVEDIFASIETYLLPQNNIQTNKYTGKDQATASGGFRIPFPLPSLGLRFAF